MAKVRSLRFEDVGVFVIRIAQPLLSMSHPVMDSNPSVSFWIRELQGGNQAAAQQLWERYFQQLVVLARQKLSQRVRRHVDEEDVALSAFKSFCQGAKAGRFPRLADRHDLWRLLMTITARKAYHELRNAQRNKRGGEHKAPGFADNADVADLNQIVGQEPTPEFTVQVAEELERLLSLLGDSTLQSVAIWKMEGYSNEEIALKLNCTGRTIERKLRLIRNSWDGRQASSTEGL